MLPPPWGPAIRAAPLCLVRDAAAREPYDTSTMTARALLRDPESGNWMAFDRPRIVIAADRVSEVVPALRRIERTVDDGGLTAVGFIAYEAAPAFDPAFRVRRRVDRLPLVVFGLFDRPTVHQKPPDSAIGEYSLGPWRAKRRRASIRCRLRNLSKCLWGLVPHGFAICSKRRRRPRRR